MPAKILIVDDHGILRAGLRALLGAHQEFIVVGEASDGETALAEAERLAPDVILADISMPPPDGIELARRLRRSSPDTRVLVLTMHEDLSLAEAALMAGAAGFLPKRAVESDLVQAIRQTLDGAKYFPRITAGGFSRGGIVTPTEIALDRDEQMMLRLVAAGRTDAQIASALGVPLQIVEERRTRLAQKLGAQGRVEMMRYARSHKLSGADGVIR